MYTKQDSTTEVSKKLAKGMIILMFAAALTKVVGYLYKIVLSRWLGPDQFGLFSLGLGIFMLVASLSFAGLGLSLSKDLAFYRGKKEWSKIIPLARNGLVLGIIVSVVAGALLYIFAGYIAEVTHKPELAALMKIFSFLFPSYAVILLIQKISEGSQKPSISAIVESLVNVARLVFVLIAVVSGMHLFGITSSFVLSTIIASFVALILCHKKVVSLLGYSGGEKWNGPAQKNGKRNLAISALPLTITTIVHTFMTWGDTVIIGIFRAAREVGIYSIVSPTAQLLSIPVTASNTVLLPLLSNLFSQGKQSEIIRVYKTATRWILLLLIPLSLPLTLFPDKIITVIAGSHFVEGSTALTIVAAGVLVGSMSTPGNMVILGMDKTRLILGNSLLAAIVNIVLNLLLVPEIGITGAALAFFFSSLAILGLRLYEVQKMTQSHPFSPQLFSIVAIGILTGLVALTTDYALSLVGLSIPVVILGDIAAIGVVYFVLILFLNPFDQEDREILRAMKKKVLFKNYFLIF